MKTNNLLLNIACGTKTHPDWINIDFSPYLFLKKHFWFAWLLYKVRFISDKRWKRLNDLSPNIMRVNLKKGIPFPNNSVSTIYHSHFLEHLSEEDAHLFLNECKRVLKVNGIMRFVIPDFGFQINNYRSTYIKLCEGHLNNTILIKHIENVDQILKQIVKDKSAGAEEQSPLVGKIEKLFRGNTEKTGELHKYMYDRFTIVNLLDYLNFKKVDIKKWNNSSIDNWAIFKFEMDEFGKEYKPGSIYIEVTK